MGPMNGGMDYPKAFRHVESWATRVSVAVGRSCANLINRAIPGKKLAGFVLVANQRTRLALPSCVRGEVIEISENGVDLRALVGSAPCSSREKIPQGFFLWAAWLI